MILLLLLLSSRPYLPPLQLDRTSRPHPRGLAAGRRQRNGGPVPRPLPRHRQRQLVAVPPVERHQAAEELDRGKMERSDLNGPFNI